MKPKMKDFQLLSLKDESKFSNDEREKYYEHLKEYVLSRKLQVTTKGALTVAPKLKSVVNKIAVGLVPILAGGNIEIVSDGQECIPEGAVIFASTHQGILDNFCWIPETPKHCIILHAADVKKYLLLPNCVRGWCWSARRKRILKIEKMLKWTSCVHC